MGLNSKNSKSKFDEPKGFNRSIGQLYRGINTTTDEDFSSDVKLTVEKNIPYVDFCKNTSKTFPQFKKNAKFTKEQEKAVSFLGWKLNAGEFNATIKGILVMGMIIIVPLLILLFLFGVGFEMNDVGDVFPTDVLGFDPFLSSFGEMSIIFFGIIVLISLGALGATVYSIYNYPIQMANEEKNRALTYVPEMIGYLIMSMKLVPNLEKSIEFSAKHGRGRIATEFKRLLWDVQIGVYESVAKGVDALAYRWGDYSTELKEALMKIRASVLESETSQRYALLDKTMLDVLESVKIKMEEYARGLNQPAMLLFYMGVLLPLILIVILPVGGAFSNSPIATPLVLFLIYCVGIPLIAYNYAKSVVKNRPPTYEPPIIPDNYPGLPKKWQMSFRGIKTDVRVFMGVVLLIGLLTGYFLSTQGFPPKFLVASPDSFDSYFQILPADRDLGEILVEDGYTANYFGKKVIEIPFLTYFLDMYPLMYSIEEGDYYSRLIDDGIDPDVAKETVLKEYYQFSSQPSKDSTKIIFWSMLLLTAGILISVYFYYSSTYKRNEQLKIMQMENEFKESMYVIASRMGENKPVETAIKQARDFLPELLITQRVFGKTVENIELLGLPIESAIFDPLYGSMKGIPSKILQTSMKLLVDSVNLGVEVASKTLMSLSMQMENMDKVNNSLKEMVSEVTATMQTMGIFIGPIVLGITVSLQKVVMSTLSTIIADPAMAQMKDDATSEITGSMGINLSGMMNIQVSTFASFATPLMFLLIIGIYVIEIVIIMTYFTTKIQEDNDLLFKMNLAKALPIAIFLFVATAVGSSIMVGMMM
ncbi:MAG: hypothetical protein PHQ98_02605 [Candidatus ainarchaeum sp.]|nr:hypothetical protein [Candidatus ainarchaeum sp.]